MKIKWAARLLLVLVGALGMGVGHAAADVMYSQTLYVRDPWGNLTGARVVITLPTVNHFYIIDMSRQFLDLPIATQLALIDQRFGLGADARAVQVVLLGIQQTRQADAQRAMEAIMQRIYQPPIVIPRPPIYQPPITIPQAPGMPSISIPQAPLYQPPIIIPR